VEAPGVALHTQPLVAALGRLEPQSEIFAIGAPNNDRLGRLLVQENQVVEAGEILGYLESHEERLAEKQYAESQLRDAEAQRDAEAAYWRANITEAELHVQQFQALPPLDIQAQEATVRQLEADLASAETDLKRIDGLRQKGIITQQNFDNQQLLVRRAYEQLNNARAVLAKLKVAYDMNLRLARAQIITAQTSATRAQTALRISSLAQNLALAQARVERTVLRAPISGMILRILTHPGESTGTQPILKMGHTRQMYAVAEVYETDVRLVRLDQRATVTSPALPEPLSGTVVRVGNMIAKNDVLAVDPAAATDVRVVEVKIRLDHSESAARLINLQVVVHIHLNELAERTQ
jgi:HlyD family secretion protein